MDHPRALKSNLFSGWKTTQALLTTLSLMVLSLVVVLALEGTRPLLLVFAPETKISDLKWYSDDNQKSRAIWASNEMEVDPGDVIVLKRNRTSSVDTTYEGDARTASIFDGAVSKNTSSSEDKTAVLESSGGTSHSERVVEEELSNMFKSMLSKDNSGLPNSSTEEGGEGVCDLTRGYWVKDKSRPLYSGNSCKRFLSYPWACRNTNRENFEYEKTRWQPDSCDLPTFSAKGFLERLENKVVAYVGDSLGREMFQSLMCMITEGHEDITGEVEDVSQQWGVGPTHGAIRGKGVAFLMSNTNTTIMFYWSAPLCEIEYNYPGEVEYAAMHLDRPDVFLRDKLHLLDLVVLNSGHHWNRGKFQSNKWRMYFDGAPLRNSKMSEIMEAYNVSIHKTVQALDSQIAKNGGRPLVFFRTKSPRHFKNGDWDSGGSCDQTRPPVAKVIPFKGPAMEDVAQNAVKGTRVHLLDISFLSGSREEAHISKYGKNRDAAHQDCLHWCLPGVPDVWNELLYGKLVTQPSLLIPSL